MAKTSVSEWSTVSSGNGDIAGLTLGLDMPPSYVNNAMQEMMAQIKQWKDGYTDPITGLPVYQSLTVENIDVVGVNNVKGEFQLNGSTGTLGQVMVSQGASALPVWGTGFPVGGIIIWSGSKLAVPSGWHLCDGTNGTPNLRSRFVVGAGTTYPVGSTGGSADAVVVSHNHSASTSVSGSTSTAGNHRHAIKRSNSDSGFGGSVGTDAVGSNFVQSEYAGEHKHSISVTASTSVSSKGVDGTNKNLPPYWALCYIMKL